MKRPGRSTWMRLAVLVVLVAAIAVAVIHRDRLNLEQLRQWLDAAGFWAPALFVLIYVAATVLFLPGSVLTLAGGALFGPIFGTFYSLTGATTGATAAFIISRYIASDWVRRKSGGRLGQIMDGVEREGWRFVALTRLVPLFPFNLLNYALGLTPIRLGQYVLASVICMLPGAAAYTYLGYVGREAVAGGPGLVRKGLLALGALALLVLLPPLVQRFRRSKKA